jgi:hypothetical protein
MIIEADEDWPEEIPPDFHWLTFRQITDLLRHSY